MRSLPVSTNVLIKARESAPSIRMHDALRGKLILIKKGNFAMDCMKVILGRRSVRKFTDRPIGDQEVHKILKAGMSGPSCVNAREWSFIVVRDKKRLFEMAEANGNPAAPLKTASLGILVCGDMARAFDRAPDYWIIDASIAAQNMILAAADLGIGSVWLGTYPQTNRVEKQKKLFDLPDNIIPHSIIAFGYPQEGLLKEEIAFEEDRVHFEKW